MNNRYEVLMLTVPEITQDETKQLETDFDRLIDKSKGSILSFERWGKFKLMYPIRGNAYGIYFLVRFESPTSVLKELHDFFVIKLHSIVMRHLISQMKDDSLVYQRPKSLEEAPTSRDMDAFLKENKMEGLLPSGGEREGKKRGPEESRKKESAREQDEKEIKSTEQ